MFNENNSYDEFGYYVGNNQNKYSLNNLNLKGKLVLGVVVIVVLIIGLVIFNRVTDYFNSYQYFEKQMVKEAREYITKNNIVLSNEIYLDMNKLNMKVKDGCNQISGVFVDQNYKYQSYLVCDNYKTKIFTNNSSYNLNGEEVTLLAKEISYIELGVKGYNDANIQGEVGTEEGVYNLNYVITENGKILANLKRKVVIVNDPYIRSLFPTITLKGENIVYLQKGEKYEESGVLAGDSKDFDLSNKVIIDNPVNVNVEGEYEVTYTVTNSRGYTNSIKRKVVVVNNFSDTTITASLSNTNKTNKDVTISLKVIGNNYHYMVLPDGSKSYSKNVTYKVSKNETYYFKSYDKDGKVVTKIIPITNISKEKPNAVCNAQVYSSYTKFYVTPYSNTTISSYNYIANGTSSGEKISSNYTMTTSNVTKASVIIKDSIGNTNEINCTLSYNISSGGSSGGSQGGSQGGTTGGNTGTYIDSKGKKCLNGFTCYNQSDYWNSNVSYCSTETCGTIAKRGCSITAFSTIASGMGIRKADGTPYNPEELVVQQYSKICSSNCSGSRALERLALRLGLSASIPYHDIGKNKQVLIDFLKKGYPVMFRTGDEGTVYTSQDAGHLMAILAINAKGEVFLSDTGGAKTTSAYNSKYKINDWVTIDEIASGAGTNWFMAICPKGACQGEEPNPGKYQNY